MPSTPRPERFAVRISLAPGDSMLPDLSPYPVHDLEACMELLDGDESLFSELIQIFTQNTAELIQVMEEAVASADLPAVARCAHSIKGSSANLAVERVRVLATELEQLARQQTALVLSPYVAAIKVEFTTFLHEVSTPT